MDKSKIYYDRNIKPVEYQEGELVMLNVPKVKAGLSKKLAPKWEGPFIVVKNQELLITKLKKPSDDTIRRAQLQSVSSVVSCPVCYESSTQRAITVLFCGHVLCKNCRYIINRGRENRHCPTCRRGDLTVYIQLFL